MLPSAPFRYAGSWSSTTRYVRNDLVVSPIDSKAYVLVIDRIIGGLDPSEQVDGWLINPNLTRPIFGAYTETTGGSVELVLSISGLTATGTVIINYINGGASRPQSIKGIVNSTNTCTVYFHEAMEVDDQVLWQVLSF